MPLVVLTYPGHFLLTALTLQSYFKQHTTVPTTIIVDDLSQHAWPGYVEDCQQLYHDCQILSVSSININSRITHPWIRQQIVKLHLDKILSYDAWFFTDGDVEYHFPTPVNSIPYTIVRGGLTQELQNNYVAMMLGIDNPGIYAEHPHMDWEPGTFRHQVCVSNPPFRSMQAKTLQQLRNHVEQLHNQSIIDLHCDLSGTQYSVSEWELIANYQLNVLKESIETVYYPTVPLERDLSTESGEIHYCATCYCSDSAFSPEWWQARGIAITDHIWQKIVNISK